MMEMGRQLVYGQTNDGPILKEEAGTSDLGALGDLRNVALIWPNTGSGEEVARLK